MPVVAPLIELKRPAGHGVHKLGLASPCSVENVPAAQFVQVGEPSSDDHVPALQRVQDEEPLMPTVENPLGQGEHCGGLVVDAKVPALHKLHFGVEGLVLQVPRGQIKVLQFDPVHPLLHKQTR